MTGIIHSAALLALVAAGCAYGPRLNAALTLWMLTGVWWWTR